MKFIVFRPVILLLFLTITTDIKTQINTQSEQSTLKKDTIKIITTDTTRNRDIKNDTTSATKTDSVKPKKENKRSKKQTNDSIYTVPAYIPYNKNRDVKKYPNSNGGASEILRDVINRNRRQ